jgi:hypothetical protein
VSRTARAVTESPISASSAPAWTSVLTTPGRFGGGATGRRGAVTEARGDEGARAEEEVVPGAVRPLVAGCLLAVGCARGGAAAVAFATEAWPSLEDGPRLLLRRCGRVRGSEPRISEGFSGGSVMLANDPAPQPAEVASSPCGSFPQSQRNFETTRGLQGIGREPRGKHSDAKRAIQGRATACLQKI